MAINIVIVKKQIEVNILKLYTLGDVAALLSISPETLKKEFLREEGVGISVFLAELRVQTMKERLITTREKCLGICLDVGLREDAGSRLFKRETGMTMGKSAKAQRTPKVSAGNQVPNRR